MRNCKLYCFCTFDVEKNQPKSFWFFSLLNWATKEKTALLSMKYWLFNRDHYNGVLKTPHNWVVFLAKFSCDGIMGSGTSGSVVPQTNVTSRDMAEKTAVSMYPSFSSYAFNICWRLITYTTLYIDTTSEYIKKNMYIYIYIRNEFPKCRFKKRSYTPPRSRWWVLKSWFSAKMKHPTNLWRSP